MAQSLVTYFEDDGSRTLMSKEEYENRLVQDRIKREQETAAFVQNPPSPPPPPPPTVAGEEPRPFRYSNPVDGSVSYLTYDEMLAKVAEEQSAGSVPGPGFPATHLGTIGTLTSTSSGPSPIIDYRYWEQKALERKKAEEEELLKQRTAKIPVTLPGQGFFTPSDPSSSSYQTPNFLSPTGMIPPSARLPVSTLPAYTFSPITMPTVSAIVPPAPVDAELPTIQQVVKDQFEQRVFGVPRSDIERFIASRAPQPRVPEYSPMLTPTIARQQLEEINRLYGIPITPPQDNLQFFREGGAVKKFADGGPAGSSSGVRRLEMSGYQEGGEVDVAEQMMTGTLPTDLPVKRQREGFSNDEFVQEMLTGTRPSNFPETSPVDTAVSDFISSRSKLVTDPKEFFRVMGQNLEEYHGKPLREDPEKYLMEQLGPGALAGTVGKTAKQLFSSLPSSEAPFVGRLDEFVSSLPGAVQKDQFLNQLKGKFRDYDIGRAEEALADLPGNAKLTPFDLLNRVKRVYDPTTFSTRIEPAKSEEDYYAEMDNPFKTEEGFSQKPLGVIHLLQGVNPATSPDAAKLMSAYDDIMDRLPETSVNTFDKKDRNPVSLTQDIYKIASRAGLSSVKDLGMDVQTVLQDMAQSGSDWGKLLSAKHRIGNPGSYKPEEIKEALAYSARITGALPEENIKSLQKIAEEINARRTAKQDYSDLESQYHSSFPYAFAEDLQTANTRLWNEHREGKQQIRSLLEGLKKIEGVNTRAYKGQHSSLAEDSSTIRDPIAFSRFTEHTTDIPGLGKVDGIYVHELQSDRLDDIRKTGRKGGGPQEDLLKLDKLDKQIGEAAKQLADYKTAMGFKLMDESDKAKISDFNSRVGGLNKRRNTLLDRIREGEYSLKESFAGMEESAQVIQQLMAKNAIAGAMQLGKRFVAFPGAESAQSQLYEKLPNNLKQVVKDLGPGFELRPITLPKPGADVGGKGGELTSYAIVWGDEASDRIKKQGVPFKDGGEVLTKDFIKRFSKGGEAEDDSWKDEIINQMNEKYSGRGPFDERMEEEMLRQRMGKEIKGLKPPPEAKVMFPNYRVVEDLKEFDNAQVFDSKPEVVFADPKFLRSNPLVLSHEFDHQMEGKARKRYSYAGDPSELKTPKEDLVLPGKPEHYLEPAGKLKVSEITKLKGGGPEYFMEQNLMGRGMSYKKARDYLTAFKEQLGSQRVRDYITKKYPDLEFFRLGAKGEELSEYLADLSGIETFKGIDLTKDNFIKQNVFGGDDDLIAEYKAVTGLRQDRLDAKDLAPYIPDYDQSLSAKAKRFIQEKLR
jgi:hypothetical protein